MKTKPNILNFFLFCISQKGLDIALICHLRHTCKMLSASYERTEMQAHMSNRREEMQ